MTSWEITRSLLKYLKPMQEVRFTHIIMLSMVKKKKFEPIKAKGDDKEEPTIKQMCGSSSSYT
ncbi:MAG: hypothetical protein QXK57_06190 [Conexivisphaerales archaeon]